MFFNSNDTTTYARFLASALALVIGGCGGGSGDVQAALSGTAAQVAAPATATPVPAPAAQTTPAPAATAPAPSAPIPPLSSNPTQLVFGGTVGAPGYWPDGDTPIGGDGTGPVNGINCADSEAYHIHAHLSIIRDGQVLAIPANIGIPAKCTYELHTHDKTGEIHMEAPAAKRFTLGNFFSVWGQPLSRTNIAGLTGAAATVYVTDGTTTVIYTGDLTELELTSHRLITIQIGKAIEAIPTFIWDTPG